MSSNKNSSKHFFIIYCMSISICCTICLCVQGVRGTNWMFFLLFRQMKHVNNPTIAYSVYIFSLFFSYRKTLAAFNRGVDPH